MSNNNPKYYAIQAIHGLTEVKHLEGLNLTEDQRNELKRLAEVFVSQVDQTVNK